MLNYFELAHFAAVTKEEAKLALSRIIKQMAD